MFFDLKFHPMSIIIFRIDIFYNRMNIVLEQIKNIVALNKSVKYSNTIQIVWITSPFFSIFNSSRVFGAITPFLFIFLYCSNSTLLGLPSLFSLQQSISSKGGTWFSLFQSSTSLNIGSLLWHLCNHWHMFWTVTYLINFKINTFEN